MSSSKSAIEPPREPLELLAPAGNWECAKAAVENGADAIYFGLDVGFNARARAANFHADDLPRLMDMLHRQMVRGYVTLNTLVFTDELAALEENVRLLAAAGVDAVLVQDLGVASVIRELCPELSLHASTQMTLTCTDAIEMARNFGVERVVLPREASLREIRSIASRTTMPLEAFVHGALCVAYSGQCLTSESFGGRSANRGQCAQACRLPYELICDGQDRDLGDVKYLLSPQDLAAHDLILELVQAGVTSFKIEGRLKTPEYVANVCQQYRNAIDQAKADRPCKLTPAQQRDLELSFSRGFSPGWLEGCDHPRLVPGLSSTKRGVLLGKVQRYEGDQVEVDLVAPIAPGDGIVIEGDRMEGKEIGSRVFQIWQERSRVESAQSGTVRLGLRNGCLRDAESPVGRNVWKTDDPQLTKRLRQSFQQSKPQKRVPISVQMTVAVGAPIELTIQSPDTPPQTITSDFVPEAARKHPASAEQLEGQFSRLGGTVYQLDHFEVELSGNPMVPLSVLGQLRHQIVERLDQVRTTRPLHCAAQSVVGTALAKVRTTEESTTTDAPSILRVLCRSLNQLEQILSLGCKHVIAEFHDLREYRDAVRLAHEAHAQIELATLRIHKEGEDGLFRALVKHAADGWLVRNLAAMRFCQQHQIPMAADFSLNVTNPLTAARLRELGATRVTASYDLNRDQLIELCGPLPTHWLEVVIHQHMPMFHMEHCVFCSTLSPGKNKSDCGRPCDRHDVKLRDRVGSEHVLHADIGCRNTLYNARAQSGAEAVKPLRELGVRQFRIELLRDLDKASTSRLYQLYSSLVKGEVSGSDVWRKLEADNRIGVTRGTLEHARNPLAIL